MKYLLIIFLLLSVRSNATTYYISASGSTGNNGTSPVTSWPISKLYSFAYTSGDFVLLNKGTTYTGTGSFTGTGGSGHPIIIYTYGNGTNPVIDAGASSIPCLTITHPYINMYNIVFQNSTVSSGLVYINGTHDIYIHNCYFTNGVRGVLVNNTTGNITINGNYFSIIADPNIVSNGGGNRVQFTLSNLSIGSCHVDSNFLYEPTPNTFIGDQISFFKDDATPPYTYTANYNKIRGGSTNTAGYNGIGIGDNTGNYQTAIGNKMVNPGAAGIVVAGGHDQDVSNDTVYSAPNFPSGAGIIYGAYNGATPGQVTIGFNILNWSISSMPVSVSNFFWDMSHSNTIQPINWLTNGSGGTGNTNATSTMLPNPLWTGSPWNSPIISYSPSYTFTVGSGVSLSPTNTGTASTNWTCSPTLPAGLSINSGTGAITGNPTSISSLTTYIVSATNAKGASTYQFTMVISGSSGKLFFSSTGGLVRRF